MTRTPLEILNTVFGYDQFRGHQSDAIEQLIGGESCLVLMPTGGGKSLCYQIPAMVRSGVGVVVSPLIALMQDQVSALHLAGVEAACLNSTLDPRTAAEVEGRLVRGDLDLIYIAPERLLQDRTLELLARAPLALFAVDEAHCISRWGHDFRPEYLKLDTLRAQFPQIPLLACTATADDRTRAEIVDKLQLPPQNVFISGFDRPNIQYRVTQKQNERSQLLAFLRREHDGHAGIVYCLSRKRVEKTADYLRTQGLTALPYHAGLPKAVRQQNQERFLREDGVIIVATIAFGMGIDKPDVRFVAHLDLPKSIEAYYQETGRAGRDGLPATAWLIYGMQDVIMQRKMAQDSEADQMHKRLDTQKLDAMLGYCEIVSCRRQNLLAYFGETLPDPCGNCDTCLEPVDTFDATVEAQKLLSCAVRTGQRFGAVYLIEVLRGSEGERIRRFGHDQLSTYGIGEDLDAWQWRSIVRQIVARGLLAVDTEGYGGLQLTDLARPVLKGETTLLLRRETLVRKTRSVRKKGDSLLAKLNTDQAGEISAPDQQLFDRLRELRRTLALEHDVPPYVIFHDKTLAAMVVHRPLNPEQMLQINGVGAKKLESYGRAFLDLIQQDAADLPPDANAGFSALE